MPTTDDRWDLAIGVPRKGKGNYSERERDDLDLAARASDIFCFAFALKDECPNEEIVAVLADVRLLIEDLRWDQNRSRPHALQDDINPEALRLGPTEPHSYDLLIICGSPLNT